MSFCKVISKHPLLYRVFRLAGFTPAGSCSRFRNFREITRMVTVYLATVVLMADLLTPGSSARIRTCLGSLMMSTSCSGELMGDELPSSRGSLERVTLPNSRIVGLPWPSSEIE